MVDEKGSGVYNDVLLPGERPKDMPALTVELE